MNKPVVRKLRCAVYTRKSSEEGLEQEFNSLHAQREACEAYITSQRAEGWVLTLAFDLPIGFEDFDPFTLSLYDDDGVLLNSIASGVSQTYQTSLSQAGDYYLAVSATYLYDFSEGGSYSLKASHQVGPTAGFESEGNNSAAEANELTLGTAITGQLATGEDLDYFKFSVTDPGALTLAFDLPPNGDPYSYFSLELYGPDGTWLSSLSSAETRTFPTILVQEGEYNLVVGAGYFSGQSVAYSLTASHVPGSTGVLESETNDTIQTADALSLAHGGDLDNAFARLTSAHSGADAR